MSNSLDGLLLFARYAFRPNRLGFCGGQNERGLFELCAERQAAPELRDWAKQFEGAYPYLKLIASANHLPDPLAYPVVEAYWLGNELLTGVSVAALYDSLRARFASRLSPRALNALLGKAPEGARPFHAFHVLDVCRRTGALAESLDTLDSCRISWGQVHGLEGEHLLVAAQPIVFANGKLVLGNAELRSVVRQIEGRGFVDEVSVGDWVSLHWGWACDRLTERQLRHLRQQTLYHLELANQTL
jgi:hydrogenase maturation factor